MKNHMKCVWMSEEVLNYVSNFEGGSFNQKFENLVLFCMKEEKSKTELLALLDERFRKRSLDLQCFSRVTYESSVLIQELVHMQHKVDAFASLVTDNWIMHREGKKVSLSRANAVRSSRPLTDWSQPVQRIRQEG